MAQAAGPQAAPATHSGGRGVALLSKGPSCPGRKGKQRGLPLCDLRGQQGEGPRRGWGLPLASRRAPAV